MAVLPSPTLVAGQNFAVYEAWYNHVDPKSLGSIGALDAANFLKKSGLSSTVLSKVWDLSDPYGRGYLDRNGFFISLKLVSLAQNGIEVSMANIAMETPPPNMGEQPPIIATSNLPPAAAVSSATSSFGSLGSLTSPTTSTAKTYNWTITSADKMKYDTLFDSLNPVNEKLPGIKVKEVLMNSTLPLETLGKIWDLADIDKDGALTRHEFAVAMHLVYKVLDNFPLPVSLPPELLPPAAGVAVSTSGDVGNRRGSTLTGSVNVLPPLAVAVQSPEVAKEITATNGTSVPWVVSEAERSRYEVLFIQADTDKDGLVSGMEIKDFLLQSRLPQPILAHIWNLCDMGATGKLNVEQFSLAMWMMQQKVQGRDLPTVLSPEMIPPSLRSKEASAEETAHSAELEQISKEIELLISEKRQLETEIAQKEADIKIKNGEVRSLQSELDTLAATLKQLEIQKREAQKRLDDLDAQRAALEQDLRGVERQIEEHENQVRTFRAQAEEQEKTLRTQEAEVASKKQELVDVRNEELRMEQQMQATQLQLEKLQQTLEDTQLQISQIKSRVTVLQEHQHQMDDALAAYDEALTNEDVSQLSDSLLRIIQPATTDADLATSPTGDRNKLNGGASHVNNDGAFRSDPFSSLNGPTARAFSSSNGDPFDDGDFFARGAKSQTASFGGTGDPFGAKDPFASAFGASPAKPTNDPFAAAFGQPKSEPFDAFGSSKTNTGADPFGSDPFTAATSSSASSRVESPTPALPPKKSKQPPPRPAPPKAAGSGGKGPQRPAPPTSAAKSPITSTASGDPFAPLNDPFASSASSKDPFGGSGFADFASFDSKFTATSTDSSFDTWGNATIINNNINSSSSTKGAADPPPQSHRYAELEFTEDPFKDVGFGDPFTSHVSSADDPFAVPTATPNGGVKKKGPESNFDPFATEKDPFASPTSTKTNHFNNLNNNQPTMTTDFDSAFAALGAGGLSGWNGGRADPFSSPLDNNNKSSSSWGDDFRFSPNSSQTKSPPTPVASSTLRSKSSSTSSLFKATSVTRTASDRESLPKLSEEAQLAWAAAESVRLEKERRRKAELQEKADLEMAIALSKSEMGGQPASHQDRLI